MAIFYGKKYINWIEKLSHFFTKAGEQNANKEKNESSRDVIVK